MRRSSSSLLAFWRSASLSRLAAHQAPKELSSRKPDHVRLGEELGDGRQLPCADLDLGGVHLILLLGLPELIDPAKAVGGGEDFQRQVGHQAFQFLLMLRRQDQLEDRGVEPEDLWQHTGGEPGGQLPAIGGAFLGSQLLAFLQSNCHTVIHQQIVLGQKAGKEHAVPVFVGNLFNQTVHGLDLATIQGIAQLTAVDT